MLRIPGFNRIMLVHATCRSYKDLRTVYPKMVLQALSQ